MMKTSTVKIIRIMYDKDKNSNLNKNQNSDQDSDSADSEETDKQSSEEGRFIPMR